METDILKQAALRFDSILKGKSLRPILEAIDSIEVAKGKLSIDDSGIVCIKTSLDYDNTSNVYDLAKSLMPWRKGSFKIDDIFIDSEWNSSIKFDILAPYINATDKVVGDIGCNNGYYLFRLLEQHPKELIGFDPGAIFYLQFKFIDLFLDSKIKFLPYGVEHMDAFCGSFDLLFCLGVIYHRTDPISTLKSLKLALKPDGELILDCIVIDGDESFCLCPKESYAKMSNVFYIPTIAALKVWLTRAGFEYEFLGECKTSLQEQRKTDWIHGQSLEDFLDPNNKGLTIEGYPAPKRAYFKCKRTHG